LNAAGRVGAVGQPPGRPNAGPTPGGGSEPRAAGSVGATFTWPVRVYWEDTDAGGIVFYANYLKFFERARTEWLRSLGLAQQRLREEGAGMFVVTHSDLRYLRPARLDDLLLVTARILEAGRASLTIEQQVLLSPLAADAAPTLLCEGRIRIGWVSTDGLRPQRIPAHLLALLAGIG
jgi:acyl-CoA thioester hydrolase